MGTNVDSAKLRQFLEAESMLSTVDVIARTDPAAAARFYDAHDWNRRRAVVEESLRCRGTAVYGTLDIDSYAPSLGDNYGEFRIVYRESPDERRFLVFPHNTAAAYVAANSISASLGDEVGDFTDRANVATAERGHRVTVGNRESWGGMIAEVDATSTVPADLLEVVARDGARPLSAVDEIRVRAEVEDWLVSKLLEATITESDTIDLGAKVAEMARHAAEAGTFKWTVV